MWLGDVEVWRTSTAEPTPDPGIVWYFLKDMTPYLSLWKSSQTLIFDLGNLINDKYTGPFNVTTEVTFFQSSLKSRQLPTREPAQLILPVSAKKSSQGSSSAFVVPGTKAEAAVKLPRNVSTAILTVAATGQASEEFWWSNVPQSVADSFNSTGGDELQGLSSFREVRVFIDGQIAGLVWPFPVVFTGGIAPPLHRPMVGLEAFDLRETEVDITPWLRMLCDGQEHTIRMEVFGVNDTNRGHPEFAHVGSNWVLSGKIFAWLAPDKSALPEHPQVYVSPMDYKSDITEINTTALDYAQFISRQITVWSNPPSYYPSYDHKTAPKVVWSQSYTMINSGVIRRSGYYQQVNSSYTGDGASKYGSEPRLQTHFRYPINMTSLYEIPVGQDGLTLTANLSQELDLAVTLHSPFATGVEPFMDRLDSGVAGSMLHARRDGYAYFSQGHDRPNIGAGQTIQHYELMALASGKLGADVANDHGPTLYKRSTAVANETMISDEEVIWGKKTTIHMPRRFEKDMIGGGASEFAPIHMSQFGGVNPFIKGIDQHHESVAGSDTTPLKGLVGQQTGLAPDGPYLRLQTDLLATSNGGYRS